MSSQSGDYTMTVNKEQARIICEALEVYSRMKHGQIDEIRNLFRDRWCKPNGSFNWDCEWIFKDLKSRIFPELSVGSYYGVASKVYPESTVAWDIMQVLRHKLAWDRLAAEGKDKPEFHGVQYNTPMRFGSEPLVRVEDVRE